MSSSCVGRLTNIEVTHGQVQQDGLGLVHRTNEIEGGKSCAVVPEAIQDTSARSGPMLDLTREKGRLLCNNLLAIKHKTERTWLLRLLGGASSPLDFLPPSAVPPFFTASDSLLLYDAPLHHNPRGFAKMNRCQA